jgi:hypothetical protein
MGTAKNRSRSNLRVARRLWGKLTRPAVERLTEFTKTLALSVADGDLSLMDGKWYVTHAGLLRLACRRKCTGIRTALQKSFCDPIGNRWVFKAVVYPRSGSRGFVGYGDADPSNVSPLVRGAEMRVAETRAVNRALRKAYGIGLCSVDELGSFSAPPVSPAKKECSPSRSNGKGQPRLRDRLCLLIRQHQLDPSLVKRYAAHFCGQELRQASRDLVESFVAHLADWATRDRAGLLCKLTSYSSSQEVHP